MPASTAARAASQASPSPSLEGAHLERRAGQLAEVLLEPGGAAVEPAGRRGVLEGDVVEAGPGAEPEGHLLADLDPVEGEQVAQRGRAAVVAGGVAVAGDEGHRARLSRLAPPMLLPPMATSTTDSSAAMRTRGHAPASSAPRSRSARRGTTAAIWVAIGLAAGARRLLEPRSVADLRRARRRSRSALNYVRQADRSGARARCSRGCRRSAARRARSASPRPTRPPRSRSRPR